MQLPVNGGMHSMTHDYALRWIHLVTLITHNNIIMHISLHNGSYYMKISIIKWTNDRSIASKFALYDVHTMYVYNDIA